MSRDRWNKRPVSPLGAKPVPHEEDRLVGDVASTEPNDAEAHVPDVDVADVPEAAGAQSVAAELLSDVPALREAVESAVAPADARAAVTTALLSPAVGEKRSTDRAPGHLRFVFPAHEPPPEAKAAHCTACGARFAPLAGEETCTACVAKATAQRSRRARVRCKVIGDGVVSALGWRDDGSQGATWRKGDVGEFSQADVASLPGRFEPL